jgi:hypothetical protein
MTQRLLLLRMLTGNDAFDAGVSIVISAVSVLLIFGEDEQDINKTATALLRSHFAGAAALTRSLRAGSGQDNTFRFHAKDWPIQPQI